MSYQYIFFDLDGTILESGQFLNDTLQYALDSIGRGYLATPRIKARFLGVPLREGLLDYCGLSEEETQVAVDAFFAYYIQHGPGAMFPFRGIPEMLRSLKAAGKTIAIATNGVGSNARRVLHGCGADIWFDEISGLSTLGAAETKSEVINGLLKTFAIQDRSTAVMVGDRNFDMAAARACGIDSIGVLYGYGTEEELSAAGATHLAATPEELRALLDS